MYFWVLSNPKVYKKRVRRTFRSPHPLLFTSPSAYPYSTYHLYLLGIQNRRVGYTKSTGGVYKIDGWGIQNSAVGHEGVYKIAQLLVARILLPNLPAFHIIVLLLIIIVVLAAQLFYVGRQYA